MMRVFFVIMSFPLMLFAVTTKNQIQWLNALYWSGGVETKVVLSHERKFPFLQGENILTRENFLSWRVFGEISPVSLNTGGEMAFSPLAIFVFGIGGKVGTGWNFLSFTGLALNPLTNTQPTQTPTPFGGSVVEMWGKGAFQFDTGAVIPGEWSHVLLYTEHSLNYRMLTSADKDTPWLYEADNGQNYNGWRYLTTSVLAYQMPLVLKNVGVLVSTTTRISHREDSPLASHGWGSDYTEWVFGPLAYFEGKHHTFTLLLQWYTERQFSVKEGHFTTWKYEKTEIKPYRLALSYAYRF
ncbi:MAG: hypothetical protein N2314_02025 [Brevinematales bacterium]|nr:hypothetical protein [Brevinematales bacterium]